jgi:hypothetical protein
MCEDFSMSEAAEAPVVRAGTFSARLRSLVPFLSAIYAFPLVTLFAVVMARLLLGIPVYIFMRDPSAITSTSPLVGAVSNIGILLWCAAGTICLFSAGVLRWRGGASRHGRFLLWAGLLTLLLMADDLFLIHEKMRYVGVSQKLVVAVYGLLLLGGLAAFRRLVVDDTEYLLLLLAVGFLGLSAAIDVFQPYVESVLGGGRILLEDGCKLLGITGWLGYFLKCSFDLVTARSEGSSQP